MAKLYESECYCVILRRSANVITEYYNRCFSDFDLTAAQYCIMINLFRLGNINASDLSKILGLERSTLVRNIGVLIKKNCIEEGGEGKGRQFMLTENGKKLLEKAKPEWEKAQYKIKNFIGEEDLASILKVADKLKYLDETLN